MAWVSSGYLDGARRFLLAAGTAEYPDAESLPSVARDLNQLTTLFTRLGAVSIWENGHNPTRDELRRRLDDWLHDHGRVPSDVLVLYYSGHGLSADDDRHYLLVADTVSDRPALTAVATEELAFLLAASKVRSVLVLLDTCYAGHGANDLAAAFIRAVRRQPVRSLEDGVAGVWVIAAARRKDAAEEGAFVQALATAVDDERHGGAKQPYLDVAALVSAVNTEFRRLGVRQRAVADAVEVEGPCRALPNPRYVPGAPEGISLAEQRRLLGDLDHWDPRARGVATEADAGWYFTGRRRVLGELGAWLGGPGLDRRPRVVTGGPGSGKSAVLSRLVTLTDPAYRRRVPAEELAQGPPLPPGSIDVAVVARGKTLAELTAEVGSAAGIQTAQPTTLISEMTRRMARLTIMVDALDEASEPSSIARELLVPLGQAASTADVRLLVGTRPHLLGALSIGAVVLDLDDDRYLDPADVADYVDRYLLGEPGSPYRDAPELAAEAASAIATKAGKTFLVARIYAATFASAATPVDVGSASWQDRPAAIGTVLEQDLARLGPDATWAGDLLRPLAYAEGAGLPWADLWAPLATALAGRTYDDEDVRRLLDEAGSYVVESVEQGHSVYRLYHQTFTDHLREPGSERALQRRIAETLAAQVPERTDGDGPDWRQAHHYVRTHLATHAAVGGLLDQFLTDPLYLSTAAPGRLARVTGIASVEAMPPTIDAFERVLHRLRAGRDGQNAAYLELAARSAGDASLADQFARLPVVRPWSAAWVQLQPTPPNRVLGLNRGSAYAMTFAEVEGRYTVVTANYQGDVRTWDVATAALRWSVRHGDRFIVLATGIFRGRPAVMVRTSIVRLFDLQNGEQLQTLSDPTLGRGIMGFAELDGRPVWIGHRGVYDMATGVQRSAITPSRIVRERNRWGRTVERVERENLVKAFTLGTIQERIVAVTAGSAGPNENFFPLVQVWDLGSGQAISNIPHRDIVTALAVGELEGRPVVAVGGFHSRVGPDELFAAVGGDVAGRPEDGFLSVIDLFTGAPIVDMRYWGKVGRLAFASQQGRPVLLAVGGLSSQPTTAGLWNLDDREFVDMLDLRYQEGVHAVAVGTMNNRAIAVSAGDNIVRVSRLASTPRPASEPGWWGHDGPVSAVTIGTYDGQRAVVSAGNDGTIRVWDMVSGWPRNGFEGRRSPDTLLRAIASSTWRGRPVVVGVGGDGPYPRTAGLRVWDLENGKEVQTLGDKQLPFGAYDIVATELNGSPVAISHTGNTVCAWDLHRGRVLSRISPQGPGGLHGQVATGTLNGRPLLVTSARGAVQVFDLATGALVGTLPTGSEHAIWVAVVERDGRSIIAAMTFDFSSKSVIFMWDLETGSHVESLLLPSAIPTAFVGGQVDGRPVVVTGCRDGVVRVWDLAAGTPGQTIELDGKINDLAFAAPDSVAVATNIGLVLLRLGSSTSTD